MRTRVAESHLRILHVLLLILVIFFLAFHLPLLAHHTLNLLDQTRSRILPWGSCHFNSSPLLLSWLQLAPDFLVIFLHPCMDWYQNYGHLLVGFSICIVRSFKTLATQFLDFPNSVFSTEPQTSTPSLNTWTLLPTPPALLENHWFRHPILCRYPLSFQLTCSSSLPKTIPHVFQPLFHWPVCFCSVLSFFFSPYHFRYSASFLYHKLHCPVIFCPYLCQLNAWMT